MKFDAVLIRHAVLWVVVIIAWFALLTAAFRTSGVLFAIVCMLWMAFLANFFVRIWPKYGRRK